MGNNNSISTYSIDPKIHGVVDYGSWKSFILFGSNLTTHAIYKNVPMIIATKLNIVRILTSGNSIFNHPIDSKIHLIVDYGSWMSKIDFERNLTNHVIFRKFIIIIDGKRHIVQILASDNSICNHLVHSKIFLVVNYGSWKSWIVFISDISSHAICRSFLMIVGKKRIFLQSLGNNNSISIYSIDFKNLWGLIWFMKELYTFWN